MAFEDKLIVEVLIFAAGASRALSFNGWYNTTIDVGFWEAATEYTIKLDAKDTAGNELKYDYTVEGLFAGVLDFLRDIWNAVAGALNKAWEAVKSAVDFIVELLKEVFSNVIKTVVDSLQSLFSGITMAYASLLARIIVPVSVVSTFSIVGPYGPNNSVALNWSAFPQLLSMILGWSLIFMGLFSIMMALEATYMVLTSGIGALANTLLLGSLKNVAIGLILGEALTSVVNSAYDASGKSSSDTVTKVLNVFGFGVGFMGLVKSIIEAVRDKADTSKFMFYTGLSLAFSGFIYSAATKVLNFTGSALMWADAVGVVLSILGIIFMGLSSIKDAGEEVRETTFSMTSLVEWILAICGVASAAIPAFSHAIGGDWQ